MPLDSMIWHNEDFKRRCIGWHLKFCLIPKRCFYTGKFLWLTFAYKGTSIIPGSSELLFEDRWCQRQEYLFLKIKGTI